MHFFLNSYLTVQLSGPRGLPLIGAKNEIKDPVNMHLDWIRLGQQYGDVFSMHIGRK